MKQPGVNSRTHFRRRLLLGAVIALFSHAVQAQWEAPSELESRVNDLTPEQAEFVRSGTALDFIPERQLKHELATRTPEAMGQLITDLMALSETMGYEPTRDMGAIPLNLNSRRYNAPRPTPAPLRDFDREPGPFSVHRYVSPQSGVPTFGGAQVAIWPEDLVAGDVDVAILGVPSNMSSGRRDAGAFPDAMRSMNTVGSPDDRSLIAPMEALSVVDYGNLYANGLSVELTVDHVTQMIANTAGTGVIPMIVGGDTSMLFPGVKGVAQAREGERFGLFHLSAHPDVNADDAHTLSDDKALLALLEQQIVQGKDTVTLGLRGAGMTREALLALRRNEVRYHTMAEVRERGFERVRKAIRSELRRGPDAVFVSVDVSIIDPAEMTAAGRIEPLGLSVTQVSDLIREVCATHDIVGFEITDLAPMMDLSRLSVLNANTLLNACLVGIALRRSGLEPDYIHPLVLNHGQ